MDPNVRDRNVVIDRGTTETGGSRELLLANLSISDALQKVGRIATTQFEVVYGRPETLIPARKVEVFSARPDGEDTGQYPAGEPDDTMTVRSHPPDRRRSARPPWC